MTALFCRFVINEKTNYMANLQHLEKELWIDIPGYEGYYQASTFGNIRSMPRMKKHSSGDLFCKMRVLKPTKMSKGYVMVTLWKEGVDIRRTVHSLVAESFLHKETEKHQVNHINGIKTDNRLENLEWVTPSENLKHAIRTGLYKPNPITGKNRGSLTKENWHTRFERNGRTNKKRVLP